MRLLVSALQMHTPECVRKRALAQLFSSTAAAFEARLPPLAGLDSEARLATYARFTQALAQERLQDGRQVEALQRRLYRNAAELGRQYSRWFRPRTVADVMAIGRVLYRTLATDFRGDARGDVVISRCYFARVFSAEVCRLMSAMDAGLFAGLSNGGALTFASRTTEGHPCCRAHFTWEGSR